MNIEKDEMQRFIAMFNGAQNTSEQLIVLDFLFVRKFLDVIINIPLI